MTEKIIKMTQGEISLENFKLLSDELKRLIATKIKLMKYEDNCCILIETLAEYLVHGDKTNPMIFDRFCEYNIMNDFLSLSNQNYRNINLRIIKSLALLLANLTNNQSLYFLLSNNFVNQIISNDFDSYDEDGLSYYVNFIKSLAFRIDSSTVQLFFHPQVNTFPLLTQALKLYNHPDPMIYNTVRNIILTLLRIKYDPIIDYISSLPTINFFLYIACRMKDMIIELYTTMLNDNPDEQLFKSLYEEIINDMMFFQDIYSLNIPKISYMLTNCILYYVVFPLLGEALIQNSKMTISIFVSLYILTLLFHYIHNETLLNCIYGLLFFPLVHKDIINFIIHPPIDPINYSYKYIPRKKALFGWNWKESFSKYVMENFSEQFVRGMLFDFNSTFIEIQTLKKKLEAKYAGKDSAIDSTSHEIYQSILNELSLLITAENAENISLNHKNVSMATGIQCGLSFREWKHCPLHLMRKTIKMIKKKYTKDIDTITYVNNIVSGNVIIFLNATDDSVILLVNLLLREIYSKIKSQEILSYTNMLPFHRIKTKNTVQGIDKATADLTIMNIGMIVNKVKVPNDCHNDKITFKNLADFSISKNFNSTLTDIDNQTISEYLEDNQSELNKNLVILLANLTLVDSSFRWITKRLLIYNLLYLIPKSNSNSEIVQIIKSAFSQCIEKINIHLAETKVIFVNGVNIFEKEWERFKRPFNDSIKEIYENPYIIVPCCIENLANNFPPILKVKQTELEVELFKCDLITFMLLLEFQIESNIISNISPVRDAFPLKALCAFKSIKIGEEVSLEEVKSENVICQINIGNDKRSEHMTIFPYEKYLLFTIKNKDNNTGKVKYKYPLSIVEISIDLSEPRVLCFSIAEQGKNMEIYATFYEVSKLMQMKISIEQLKNEIVNIEYKAMDKYFNSFRDKNKE